MQLCSKCHKRVAVVFVSKFVDGKVDNEGYCLKCARELGISQVDAVMKQYGITEEDLEKMEPEIEDASELPDTVPDEGGSDDGKAPPINFMKLFSGMLPFAGGMKTEKKPGVKGKPDDRRKFLGQYCTDLTAKAKNGGIDRIVGRDRELARVMQILCRRQKNNPCLIGEPGVGKTAVAEALAIKIAAGDVPFRLRGKEVHLVDMTAIVAGTQFRGQFETRMKGLIDEVKSLGNIILVIDEVHTIASAGDAEGSMNAANILKPALSRGEIQVIGATTLVEYRKYIEKDAALERRFQPVIIDEPSVSDCVEILKGIKGYYESYHRILIPDETLERAVKLSERYITDRYLPDKAIDLLDESLSFVALNSDVVEDYRKTEKELADITSQREAIESADTPDTGSEEKKYRELAEIRVKELNVRERYDDLKTKLDGVTLTDAALAKVIEIWTGIPASNIMENDSVKLMRLADSIKSRIVGQDHAVDAVVKAIKRNRAGVSAKRKPVSFIFAGPTGVGKTELVKTLAAELFDSPETLIRLDMSEFMEKFSVSRIIGAPPGYVGYDEAGQLTEKIRRKPYSVILFDEIEKAHPDVMNILLQILDDGRITDAQGRTVNFENTVIVMTTNAGSTDTSSAAGFGGTRNEADAAKTEKALSSFLRPEFLNRVDEVIVFNRLTRENFAGIAKIMLNELADALSEKGIKFAYTDSAADFIAEKSFDEKYGARNMRRYIQREVEDIIADRLISEYAAGITAISLGCDGNALYVTSI
ncbi:MAG: ATP-dependent Clp protease ATP-binding subunit [Firmicutes bacterium]|uniref:ATP-dependent Clp protease ATP-binding subunit n=2 Tax=Candidatus Colimorpha enterica TaxID=3083063 RepID=A0AAE3JZL9_9BACT|nr:ATP-dependent Clp protease ATP-binding subunit [Candidatus Colimorpha enterica]MDY2905714.1 ATP-dependent Clp protease ATP-binding subunit [Eubacteriales bacterium]